MKQTLLLLCFISSAGLHAAAAAKTLIACGRAGRSALPVHAQRFLTTEVTETLIKKDEHGNNEIVYKIPFTDTYGTTQYTLSYIELSPATLTKAMHSSEKLYDLRELQKEQSRIQKPGARGKSTLFTIAGIGIAGVGGLVLGVAASAAVILELITSR